MIENILLGSSTPTYVVEGVDGEGGGVLVDALVVQLVQGHVGAIGGRLPDQRHLPVGDLGGV